MLENQHKVAGNMRVMAERMVRARAIMEQQQQISNVMAGVQ
jgi:uncharacterized protein YjcR